MKHLPKSLLFRAIACAVVVSSGVDTARADVVTLRALEQHALETSVAVEGRVARVESAEARVAAVRAEVMPRLSLDAGSTIMPGGRVTPVDCPGSAPGSHGCTVISAPQLSTGIGAFAPSFRLTAALRLDGVVYDFGRTRARLRAARAEADATSTEVTLERESTVRAVRAAYLEWFGAFLRRRFVDEALAVAEQRVADLDSALEVGARPASDRDAARIEVVRVRVELARARAAESDARLVLARTSHAELAEDDEPDLELTTMVAPILPRPASTAVVVMEHRREAIDEAVRAHQLRHAPFLTAGLRFGVTSTLVAGAPASAFPAYSIDVGLTVPLWDPRTGDPVLADARAQAAALTAASEATLETTSLLDERARLAVQAAETELELTTQLEQMSRDAAASAEEHWRIAGGSIEAVMNARERERRAHEETVRASLGRARALLALQPID